MQSRGCSNRLPGLLLHSRIWSMVLTMFATMASVYVAGRLWQDAENKVHLIKELNGRTTLRQSVVLSVDGSLKVLVCRDQNKRLSALEMELAAARHEGFVPKYSSETNEASTRKGLLAVIGIITGFGGKKNRDALRKSWLPTVQDHFDYFEIRTNFPIVERAALKKLEQDKGIIVRFVVGRSANRGDSFDRAIDDENKHTKDFIILDNHVETSEELPKKTKLFFVHAADNWDSEFYAKVNDDIYVKIGISFMLLVKYMSSLELWRNIFLLIDQFSVHMPMMMSALVHG